MKQVQSFAISKGSGKAFIVQKGQVLRISQPEGPAVADFDAFNADNPRECLGSSVTRTQEGIHITTGSRLWSCPSWERIMFTVLADTVKHEPSPSGVGSHDFLYGRCSRTRRIWRYGSDTPGCQEILASAIEAFGLAADYVHDPFNVFMKTGVDKAGKLFYEEPDARKGDYVDLRAEMTCIAALSACPGMSSGPVPLPFPVGVEIYTIE